MRFITAYLTSICLLTLVTACDRQASAIAGIHEVEQVDGDKIEALVKASSRPYVLVNFYSTYCKPCIKEIPDLIKLKNNPASEVEVHFISLDEPDVRESMLAGFLTRHSMNFRSFHYDPAQVETYVRKVYPKWNRTIPLNILYDNTGRVVEITGMTDPREIELIISKDQSFR